MAFFKKLKDRLLTLNIDDDKDKKKPKVEKPKKESKPKKDKDEKLKNKFEKNVEKENLKRRKKQKNLDKYVAGMEKSGSSFSRKIKEIQARHNKVDEEFFEELEESLVMSDISISLVMDIISEIKKEVKLENVQDPKLISEIIADKIFTIYTNKTITDTTLNIQEEGLTIFLVVGVNGVGKTTSIAKISHMLKNEGKKVLVAAGDTFRAGATEQLNVWTDKIGVDLVKAKKLNADPASVVYESLEKAQSGKYDALIIDTAGRLQNKVNLMNELEKINKIIKRTVPEAPHESLLVLDATTGQNGISQAKAFKEITPLSGIVLTKMDGTSKGGIVLTIKDELDLSVKMIGFGEGLDDLQEFDLDAFIYGLTKDLIGE